MSAEDYSTAETTKIRRVAKAILMDGDEVLLLKRSPNSVDTEGLWDLPGGTVEPGEDPVNATIRECREEIGLEVKIIKHLCRFEAHHYNKPEVLLCDHYLVEADAERIAMIRLSEEHVAYEWVLLERVKSYKMLNALKENWDLILECINDRRA